MAGELAVQNGSITAEIERVLMEGDLSRLTVEQRMAYYNATCTSLGLNPLTRPFDYIRLNNKLTLYAKRDCTDQLRKIHRVSIKSVSPQKIDDLYVVVTAAEDGTGRTDQSTGAVNIANLKGEALANAMMKAETKAKRRVTLSICGLGLLDETEVDTLKQQGFAQDEERTEVSAPVEAQHSPFGTIPPDKLHCVVIDVLEKETPKKVKYLQVILNGKDANGNNFATCFDTGLSEALHGAKGKECILQVKVGDKFANILDVLIVDGVNYAKGQPVIEGEVANEPV